jgi:hypothetical protein
MEATHGGKQADRSNHEEESLAEDHGGRSVEQVKKVRVAQPWTNGAKGSKVGSRRLQNLCPAPLTFCTRPLACCAVEARALVGNSSS